MSRWSHSSETEGGGPRLQPGLLIRRRQLSPGCMGERRRPVSPEDDPQTQPDVNSRQPSKHAKQLLPAFLLSPALPLPIAPSSLTAPPCCSTRPLSPLDCHKDTETAHLAGVPCAPQHIILFSSPAKAPIRSAVGVRPRAPPRACALLPGVHQAHLLPKLVEEAVGVDKPSNHDREDAASCGVGEPAGRRA